MNKNNYSIGVVDYLGRFDDHFVPLIKSLSSIFPDREVVCVLNGHHDKEKQISYLKKATSFLASFPNVRYLTYEEHQPLAKCWNQIILMSNNNKVLILNDDLTIDPLFREDFEKNLSKFNDFFVINESWSHFLISKSLIRKIGWFEERLLGIGWEDADYMFRMGAKNIPIDITTCRGVRNLVAPSTNASWAKISKDEGKYSKVNKDFFDKKWKTTGEEDYEISFTFMAEKAFSWKKESNSDNSIRLYSF